MTLVRRLQAFSAATALLAGVTCHYLWGDTSPRTSSGVAALSSRTTDATHIPAVGRFAGRTLLTYETVTGERLFALQLQPQLAAAPAKPRDVLLLVDTSASQAGGPLQRCQAIAAELVAGLKSDDRVSLWTASTPDTTMAITTGFVTPAAAKVALEKFGRTEYAAGATDLGNAIHKAGRAFEGKTSRQQVLVYLGDGESTLNPLNDADRAKLATDLVERDVTAFLVPVGTRLDSKNLHGLAINTGGAVVRVLPGDKLPDAVNKLTAAFAVPVMKPTSVSFGPEVSEFLPAKLPPLRGDAPTLVVGTLKDGANLTVRVDGTVHGEAKQVTQSLPVPAADASNYFLVATLSQWRKADPTVPAYVRADRGLAMAYEQTRLSQEECLNQAYWALSLNQHGAAQKLFTAAQSIDPRDEQAANGLKVVAKLKSGALTKTQLTGSEAGIKFAKVDGTDGSQVVRERVAILAQDVTPEAPTVTPTPTAPGGTALLEQERRRRAIVEQQFAQSVDESVRRARELVRVDPDAAYDLLERQRLSVGDNPDLNDAIRAGLLDRVTGAQRTIRAEGVQVKQQQEADLRRRIAEDTRRDADRARVADEEKVRERVRAFTALMNQARYNEAYQEALQLQREQIAAGRPVPVQAVAAYNMGLNAANLKEYENTRRMKEERFMLTMLRVDESHIPFPDEPPVAFPAVTFWKEITRRRQDKYEYTSLGGELSPRTKELRRKLYDTTSLEANEVQLKDLLGSLSANTGITFVLNTEAFKNGKKMIANAEEQMVKYPKLNDVSVSTVLDLVLKQLDGTYIVRRDYIELTSREDAIGNDNKAVRAYAVADLVIPFPDAVNASALQQNLQVLGSSLSANGQAIFGSAGGGLNLGNSGGVFGGALGISIGGGLGGALGGGGVGGGVLGGVIGNPNAPNGGIGFAGGTGSTNLGNGGGTLGFGGGQLGQFGNLGGQFGLQGGNTSNILISMIEDTIARKEWDRTAARYLQQNTNQRDDEEGAPIIGPDQLNSLGYYPTSRALVVRGSSRINPHGTGGVRVGGAGAGAAAPMDRGGNAVVFAPGQSSNVLAAKKIDPKAVPAVAKDAMAKDAPPRDPKTVWQDAMAKNQFQPRQVIAVADVLATAEKFEDVAELLKADLRQGVMIHDCVFEALAVALQGSQASSAEVERARLSGIDLQPERADSYLKAAEALDEMGQSGRAVALCKIAAKLEPNSADAYSRALVCAAKSKELDTDAASWAAGNLLKREWPVDGAARHAQAQTTVDHLAAKLTAAGRAAEAGRLKASLAQEKRRDLVIEAAWVDDAEVGFQVVEPTGSVCSERRRQTPGGGAYTGERFSNVNKRGYVASEAFSGTYEVKLEKVWGKPLGNKVTVRTTLHQGTPNEVQELHTVALDAQGKGYLMLNVDNGRRTELASVPVSANPAARANERSEARNPDRVFNTLRAMTEGLVTTDMPKSMRGGTSAGGRMSDAMTPTVTSDTAAGATHVNRVGSDFTVGMGMTAQATVAADRKSMKVSLTPAFQTASETPEINLTLIPGGR